MATYLIIVRKWTHDNIVNYLQTVFSARGLESVKVYADLEGHRTNGVTFPSSITITSQKHNVVIVNRKSSPPEEALVKLTIAWASSSGMESVRLRRDE